MTKILLVDDSDDVLEFYKENIERIDKNIILETAKNGEEALKKFSESSYSMILTDYIMPRMNGFVLTKCVRKLDKNIPIIIATGYIETLDDSISLDLNTTVVAKPFSLVNLREIVEGFRQLSSIKATKIMIVDDSSVTRFVLSNILRKKGYLVIEAESGADCLNKLKRYSDVDAIITDQEMIGMNGLELIQNIRNCGMQTKIAVISASHSINIEELKKVGVMALISKPFEEECIHATIELILKSA